MYKIAVEESQMHEASEHDAGNTFSMQGCYIFFIVDISFYFILIFFFVFFFPYAIEEMPQTPPRP